MNRLTEGLLLSAAFLLCSLDVNSDTFGIEDSDVVVRKGDHRCGAKYDQGSWPNSLCKIGVAEIANEVIGSRWVGTAVLIAKEFTDKNISRDDIWFGPYPLDNEGEVQIAINADKGFIIGYSFKF